MSGEKGSGGRGRLADLTDPAIPNLMPNSASHRSKTTIYVEGRNFVIERRYAWLPFACQAQDTAG